jgi:3-methylfumaryl-CoA hydratase
MATINPDRASWQTWLGRKEFRADAVGAWPVIALTATFDRNDPDPGPGDVIPPGWHWLYFLEATPASGLGVEGHPKVGGFLPETGLPRRMWAGGRIQFIRALRVGDALRRDSEIVSIEPKQGRSGRLVFVTIRHTVTAAGEVAVVEEHDVVYREAAKPGEPSPAPKPAPREAAWRREVIADPVMLFRYSALTFIGHRIHYDIDYCREEEGYPGLVVHGPLQTLLLLDLCRRHDARPVTRIEYRALHPVFHFERFSINGIPSPDGATSELWTANAAGNYGMRATVCFV